MKQEQPKMIEVYEWEAGKPRPGSQRGEVAIDFLAVPDFGQVPQIGDVLNIYTGDDPSYRFGLAAFVVIERELLWGSRPKDDTFGQTPLPWDKMWIHVRRIADYEQAASAAIG
jgi:hypothetical protein